MRITLIVLSTSLAMTGACGHSSPGAPVAVANVASVAGPSLADPLALVPDRSDVVMKLDFGALRRSPLFTRHRGMLRDFMVPGFADCKYDPFDDIETVTLGIPMGTELSVFVVRGLDRDRTLRCLRTSCRWADRRRRSGDHRGTDQGVCRSGEVDEGRLTPGGRRGSGVWYTKRPSGPMTRPASAMNQVRRRGRKSLLM